MKKHMSVICSNHLDDLVKFFGGVSEKNTYFWRVLTLSQCEGTTNASLEKIKLYKKIREPEQCHLNPNLEV